MTYEAIRGYITTSNAPDGSVIDWIHNYERSGRVRDRRGDAISDGFDLWGHDDFNVAVWDKDRLVSWDWMDEALEPDPSELRKIELAVKGEAA